MNDENCPPQDKDVNLSMSSVKAGAAVFGNLVFGSEYPEHSLCYSPSPLVKRHSNEDALQQPMDGKVLSFDKTAASPKKPQEKALRKKVKTSLRQKEPKRKAIPHRKNPGLGGVPRKKAGYKQPGMITDLVGDSVNPTINGGRRSKKESLKEKMMSVAELREQRHQAREEMAAFNVKAEQTRKEVIELRKRLNERFRQSKVDREQKIREQRIANVENEIQFKSQVHVEHKRTLKEQEDTSRRMSMDARAKLRKNHQEGKERMKLASVQEDQALFEERHASSVATRNVKADNAANRRNSFSFRNGDARRIRELHSKTGAEMKQEEHGSYELKWAGERDADGYKRQMAHKKRDSFAFRNAEGRRIRDIEVQMKTDENHDEHKSNELKWDGDRDADDYKRQMAQERRDSFAFRNAEGKRIRELEGQMKANEHHTEHESNELKWDGERDADNYKKKMVQQRRDSLASRNAEGSRIRDLESQMKAGAQQDEHESFALKWDGERDADDHRKQMAQQRRGSLFFRNAEGKRIRDLEGQMKADEHHTEHESNELKWAGERDAENYMKQMAQQKRDSFASRNIEGKRIRDLEGQMKSVALQDEHDSYELKWAGERNADDYKKQMAEERMESLAFRNAEGKRIRHLEGEMKAEENHNEHESNELKWAGERDAENYRKQVAQQRRDSFAFRNAEGKRIGDVEGQMKSVALQDEHDSYELKWAGECDADNYKKQMDKERRDSLAFRNAESKRIRDVVGQMKAEEQHNEHKSFELKWAGDRDADDYKKQMAQKRRESLAFRNAEGKRICSLEGQMKSDAQHEDHESYELKWAGERDAFNYKKQMDGERRESFNCRNQESARHDAVMKELLSLAQEGEHESYILKWAGENDSKQYLADQAELRRQSLAFRNAEGRRHRGIDEENRVQLVGQNAQNEELNAACQRDIQHNKKKCAARDQASLRLKGKEYFSSRMQAENDREAKTQEDHDSHLLDTAAWQDVNDYVGECNRRKRLSLAFRAKEKRRHFRTEKEQAELKIHQQQLDTRYRSEDARYIELAKLEEKARIALEAMDRPPTCSFGGNPFATLLG